MRPLFARPSLIGAVLALLVGGAAYVYLSDAESTTSSAVERTTVVVATRDVPVRDRIVAGDLELREVPVEAVHSLAVRDVDAAMNMFALSTIRAGEQVLSVDLGTQPGGSALSKLLPEGMRALSIAVSDAVAAGGLVEPGDRVDLMGVFEESKAGADGSVQVAENLEVLAVSAALLGQDDSSSTDERRGSPTSVSATVTLAMSPEVAQRVALADEFGSLRIVLRSSGDQSTTTTRPVELDDIIGVISSGVSASAGALGPGS
ncbi:MAG: Flp pilus assembly protein CpaB [Dehalococcoidia bacterium]